MEKQNWLSRVFTGTLQERSEPLPGVVPPLRESIGAISVDTAMSISAVYRSVSIITSSISQMPLAVYRDGIAIKTPTLIKQPNIDESQRAFVKKTVWSLVTNGNAYWRVYGDYPAIQNLEVLDYNAVSVATENGKVKYWVHGKEVAAKYIKHLRLEQRPGVAVGIGPIQRGQAELIGALRLKNFQDNWFGIAGIPSGILTTDQTLSTAQQNQYAVAWNEFINTHGTAVLGNGMRYEHLSLKPAEAQFQEVMQAKTTGIARLFGVPATLLASGNEGTSNVYMNNQELFLTFLMTTLTDYMNEVEDAFSSLLPRGQEVSFKEDALLRMNSSLEVEVQSKQIESGLRTANELRAAAGLPPLSTPKPVAAENPNSNKDETEDDES